MTKKNGAAGSLHYSPRKRAQRAKRRRAQERRWAAKSGPVVIVKPADTT